MRPLLLVPLLIASHGLVIWAGVKTVGQGKESPTSTAAPHAPKEEKIKLSQFMVAEEPEAPSYISGGPDWEDRYKAALESIAAGADLAAMVMAGAPDAKAVISPETCAAFTLWMERDAVEALRWFTGVYGQHNLVAFAESFRDYVASHPVADLDRLLLSVPDARGPLIEAATSVAKGQGLDAILKLAAGLSDSYARSSVLISGTVSMDGIGPHLAAIRGGLDEQGMQQFLWNLANKEYAAELRDAVRSAGFSERALQSFENQLAASAEDRRQRSQGMAGILREGGLAEQTRASQFEGEVLKSFPDFRLWCQDFADSRVSADEVMARLMAGIPGSQGSDDAMREFLFRKLYPMDPETALAWLREHRSDWQGVVKKGAYSSSFSLEKFQRVADSMSPEDLKASGLEQELMYAYGEWYKRDPEYCLAAAKGLPESHLKKRVWDIIDYHNEQQAQMK